MNNPEIQRKSSSTSFQDEMDRIGVTPTGSDARADPYSEPPSLPESNLEKIENSRVLLESLSIDPSDSEHEIEENESLRKHSLSRRDFRALRQGKFAIQSHLDLHGHTVAESKKMILDFIDESSRRNRRCIRIVHGKGLQSPNGIPKIKILCHKLLAQHKSVVGYCKARPVDGGSGASIVLLRR